MPAIKLDIRKFYSSTKWGHVYRCFHQDFECAAGVSAVLASILCFRDGKDSYLPTGSAASQIVAFYTHKPMFDAIEKLALARNGIFTLYVDDMVLSLPDASPVDIRRVGRLVNGQGLAWHKERFFAAGVPKRVTGTIAKSGKLEANKRQHFKYRNALLTMDKVDTYSERVSAARRAVGLIQSIAQIDARYAVPARGMSEKLRSFVS
jgi:hypothetical protein